MRAEERPAAGIVEQAEEPMEAGGRWLCVLRLGPSRSCMKLQHIVFAIGVMLGREIIVKCKVQTERLLASNPDVTGNVLVARSWAPKVASPGLSFSVNDGGGGRAGLG